MTLALGYPHPDWLCDLLTPEQMNEWWEYYKLDPFGDDWERTAVMCATIANVSGNLKKALSVDDFMPQFETKKTMKTQQGKLTGNAALEQLQGRFGKKDNK